MKSFYLKKKIGAVCGLLLLWPFFVFGLNIDFNIQNSDQLPSKEIVQDLKKQLQKIKSAEESESQVIIDNASQKVTDTLHAFGYYQTAVDYQIQQKTPSKWQVSFIIAPGPVFKVNKVILKHSPQTNVPAVQTLKIQKGQDLRAEAVLETAKELAKKVEELNCFQRVSISHQAVLDYKKFSADLNFTIEDFPQTNFGDLRFNGLTTICPDYLIRQVPWEKGTCFKVSKIKDYQRKLWETDLFKSLQIDYASPPDEFNQVPITVNAEERPHRTIKVGVGYESDNGPGIYFDWAHRNFFHRAEKLNFSTKANLVEQAMKINYIDPYFFADNKSLHLSSEAKNIDSDQYESISWNSEAIIKHKLNSNWQINYGLGYRLSEVTEFGVTDSFSLVFLPLKLIYDSRDNLLDPSKGQYFDLSVAPYYDLLSNSNPFTVTRANHMFYYALNDSAYTILAFRTSVGSIMGTSQANIPADLRFFAGGGQSVRGYEYQSLSIVKDELTLGGRSLIELSAEFRQKITDKYGFALFADGGNVFNEVFPDFSETIRWAAGVGFRYYSGVGPIRVDIAFPVNKRSQDKVMQFYFSIGQAF